ncbi:MAG: hypothetical protein U1E67_17565 [Hyphomicrobiales bacterium]
MSKRIDKSWVVFNSVENDDHDSCVDVFYRPDGSFGFESFRRDIEDLGAWTPLGYFSSLAYRSSEAAYAAAEAAVPWLSEVLIRRPALRRHPSK